MYGLKPFLMTLLGLNSRYNVKIIL